MARSVDRTQAFCLDPLGGVVWLPARRRDGTWLPPVHANASEPLFRRCMTAAEEVLRRCPTPRHPDGTVNSVAGGALFEQTAAQLRATVLAIDGGATRGYWADLARDVAGGGWAEVGLD